MAYSMAFKVHTIVYFFLPNLGFNESLEFGFGAKNFLNALCIFRLPSGPDKGRQILPLLGPCASHNTCWFSSPVYINDEIWVVCFSYISWMSKDSCNL